MTNRILVTSTDLMMVQFLVPHIKNLSEHGYDIDLACSEVGGRMDEVRALLDEYTSAIHTVRLVRSPFSLTNLKGFRDMKKLLSTHHYDVIWTNEPVMGVATRLAARQARKQGTKVIYMVHGFHFYKGAPFINWLLFCPVETFASRLTDTIVTINKEDYYRARVMHAHKTKYIHGIGVDTSRFDQSVEYTSLKAELELSKDTFLIVSVGELLPHKNQQVIIKALGQLHDESIHYILCGKGEMLNQLLSLAAHHNVSKQVHFLGYRKDLQNIFKQVDLMAFPSSREGLGLAALEGMYCGLPLLTSCSRGAKDFMQNGKTGFMYAMDDVEGFAVGIKAMKDDPQLREVCGAFNREAVKPFCLDNVKKEVLAIIEETFNEVR